jgi:hypothetical protein
VPIAVAGVRTPARPGRRSRSSARHSALSPSITDVAAYPGSPALFGKLYALTHLRADRWYKLGRMMLYGALEDEKPFNSVRRLVEYEDYILRLMTDVGVPSAAPYGFVELTPEREYLLVAEFLAGGKEILDAEVSRATIRDALSIIRRLWNAGIAHRDVKSSNLLARDGKVFLIDVAFVWANLTTVGLR